MEMCCYGVLYTIFGIANRTVHSFQLELWGPRGGSDLLFSEVVEVQNLLQPMIFKIYIFNKI
jgi:hypothetical protein